MMYNQDMYGLDNQDFLEMAQQADHDELLMMNAGAGLRKPAKKKKKKKKRLGHRNMEEQEESPEVSPDNRGPFMHHKEVSERASFQKFDSHSQDHHAIRLALGKKSM